MRAYQLPRGGAGIDALVQVERPDPKSAYRQVVVKVPGPQRREFGKGRQVETAARRHKPLDGRRLREMHKQALGGLLVLAEVPNAPEERQARREASFRP